MNMSPYLSRIEGPPPKRDAARSNRAGDANPPKTLCFRGIHFCYSVVSVPSVWDHSMYDDVAYTLTYTVHVSPNTRFDYILTTCMVQRTQTYCRRKADPRRSFSRM